jgi:phosphoserine phosphatase RsbU/P
VTPPRATLPDAAEELFEEAPCGYLLTRMDGTLLGVNRTFETMTGHRREDLVGERRFVELLAPGGRIYHETHYAPLLRMQGSVNEIALEFVRADGSRLPALVNAVVREPSDGRDGLIRTAVFAATDRRSYERELAEGRRRVQEIAQQLQESLLAGAVPSAAELDIGVSYQSAVAGLDVGGDWYDAFWVEPGRTVALVVGDVVGRGIGAAATMGQLRSALRALASTGLEPGELLGALDGYARRHEVGRMTTIVYGHLRLDTGELRYACAGHPPPLIIDPAAPPAYGWEGRSTPLDTLNFEGVHRPTATVTVPAGGSVLFYTDGLIERRGESLDVGMGRLLDEVGTHRAGGAQAGAEAIGRSLRNADHLDDVCVLLARRGA